MADYLISREDAESDLLLTAAFIAERIPSSDGRAEAMNAIVPRLLIRENVDLAAALADTIEDPFSRDRLLVAIASRCVDLDDDEYALQLADAVEEDATRSEANEAVAIRMAAKGRIETARRAAENVFHAEYIDAAIAVRAFSDGEEDSARDAIAAIEFPSARLSARREIAAEMYRAGRADDAAEYLDKSIADAAEIEHDEERIRAYREIASALIETERRDAAATVLAKVRDEAKILDNQHRDYFLSGCAIGFLQAGMPDDAEAVIDLIRDKTHLASAMLGVARDEWKRDEKEAALETLDEAHQILKSQHERETRDSRSRNVLMGAIAVQFAGFEDTARAIDIAREIADADEINSALTQIARVLVAREKIEDARGVVDEIEDDSSRLLAISAVADELIKHGRTSEAQAMLADGVAFSDTVDRPVAVSRFLYQAAASCMSMGEAGKAREISLKNLNVIGTIRDEANKAASLAAAAELYDGERLAVGEAEAAATPLLIKSSAF